MQRHFGAKLKNSYDTSLRRTLVQLNEHYTMNSRNRDVNCKIATVHLYSNCTRVRRKQSIIKESSAGSIN
ncbi:hypothetical protein BH11BAC6_BH11BAC6_13080 [soil metagenome]